MKWLMRVFAVCWLSFFVGMQIWAGFLWASEGPPPPLAVFAEIVAVSVTVYIGWLVVVAESG